MTSVEKRGVLYIVFDDVELLKECVHSASTLRKYSPGIPSQLITNLSPALFKSSVFDSVDLVTDTIHPLKAKVKYLFHTNFETTLFLDADTEIRSDISELFSDLGKYDLGITYDNECDWESEPVKFIRQKSNDINTGMILYRNTPAVMSLLHEWLQLLLPQEEAIMRPGTFGDQWYFNKHILKKAISGETVQTKILSNEIYNVRPWCWSHLKREKKFRKAKILHAHHLHHGFFTKLKRKLKSLTG